MSTSGRRWPPRVQCVHLSGRLLHLLMIGGGASTSGRRWPPRVQCGHLSGRLLHLLMKEANELIGKHSTSVVSHVDSRELVECGAVCPPPVGDGCWGKACTPIMSGGFVPWAVCPRQWATAAPGAVCPPQWAMAAPETKGGENRKKKEENARGGRSTYGGR